MQKEISSCANDMKIYFAGSITGGRDDVEWYKEIIQHLRNYGQVLTEHIASPELSSSGEARFPTEIYDRDIAWLREADVLIAEVTKPSLGVGYEIGFVEALGKPVLYLYRPQEGKKLSAMLTGNRNPHHKVTSYRTMDEAKGIIAEYFQAMMVSVK